MFPFICLVNSGVLFNYELVCKLNSNPPPEEVIDTTGKHNGVEAILKAFNADLDLGMVTGGGQQLESDPAVALLLVAQFCNRLGFINTPDLEGASLPAGGWYWLRPLVLRLIAALKLSAEDFECELGRERDLAHSIEQMMGLICVEAGMRIATPSGIAASPPLPLNHSS